MREIVTIQVGGFANFIGSHFWNFQDEYLGLAESSDGDPAFNNQFLDMDVLYRTGETQQGMPTYTPRLVSVDFQGSLGSLSSTGSLYGSTSSPVPSKIATWVGSVTKHVSKPCKKNSFLLSLDEEEHRLQTALQNGYDKEDCLHGVQGRDHVECLERGVKFWTDFSKVHYHPKSLFELKGLWLDEQAFDNYGMGKDVFSTGFIGEEINERLRFLVEDCDSLQGMQFVVDDSGGFSSIAADFLENIAEEYGNTPLMLYTVRAPRSGSSISSKNSTMRSLHDAVSLARLSPFCRLLVPIGLPFLSKSKVSKFLCIEDNKPFHTSAIYAAALNSISLPFRMMLPGPASSSDFICGAVDIAGMTHMLADQGRRSPVAVLDMAMPAPSLSGDNKWGFIPDNLHSLMPDTADDANDAHRVESIVIHGALQSGRQRASLGEVRDLVWSAYQSNQSTPRSFHLSAGLAPLPVPLPFPAIFGNHVGQQGELLDTPMPGSNRCSLDVYSVPMAARLRSSIAILPYLERRLGYLCKFGIERGAPGSGVLQCWGFPRDELEEMKEALLTMMTTINPLLEAASDSE